MNINIVYNYRDNHSLRQSFNSLAEETYGFHFENWYQNGFWTDQYQPYSIVIEDQVVSNVSVNKIECELLGQSRHYIQLGTVMTKTAFRNKGYVKILMNRIFHDHQECDGFFLFANDIVLDFYPKFGFTVEQEYRYFREFSHEPSRCPGLKADPVPMKNKEDWKRFLIEKKQRFSNGILQLKTDNLLMFYLTQYMQEDLYYIDGLDAFLIGEVDEDTLILQDIFSKEPVGLMEVCNAFGSGIKKVRLAFTPENTEGFSKALFRNEDTTLFIAGEKIREDMKIICSFPDIAHA